MQANVPTTLNGFAVIASRPHYNGAHVVVVHMPGKVQPWCVALWSPAFGNEWNLGHYFACQDRAMLAFQNR